MDCLKYDDTELDKVSLMKVREELNENEENRRICLESLRRELTDKKDLNPCLSDAFLLSYLRVAKFDCTKAYRRILKLYEERRNAPSIFEDYSPRTVKIVENARQFYASPYRMKDNSAILILKRGDYDPSKIQYELIIRALSMIADTITHHPLNQMYGANFILDLSSSPWGGWSEYTPSRIKLVVGLVQKAVALRIRSVHIINAPVVYYLIYTIAYPLLSTKIRNRIILHKNYGSLQSYIEPEHLPEEYGGYLDQSDLINLFERLYKMEDFFESFSKFGYKKKK